MAPYRFHVLGIPHTATNALYTQCAFTQKVLRLCAMLKGLGHHVIHYGNELSDVVCDQHVSVAEADEIPAPDASGVFDENGPLYRKFYNVAIGEIEKRKQPRDFLLCMWGAGHKPVADAHPDLIAVEPGIGYAGGHFAPWKVFESYAVLHAFRGLDAVKTANGNGWWYDAVIPNSYDPAEFSYSPVRGDYLLFMGMRSIGGEGKGVHIAVQIAKEAGLPLIVAGPGVLDDVPGHVKRVGFVNGEERRTLLSGARALLAPSLFIEPFCGVVTEAHMSGTPTITCDWGAFAENNLHGITGYRCRTFEQFVWAAKNISNISRRACRTWAVDNFSTAKASTAYDEYFRMVMDVHAGKGWYEPHPERFGLDWLKRKYPASKDLRAV